MQARVSFLHADAATLALDPESFDSVILGEVIEHSLYPERLREAVRRAVKPGGRIIVTTPFGVLEHADHKQTCYLSSFLRLLTPFAHPVALEILGKRICFTGEKRTAAHPQEPSFDAQEVLEKSEQAFFSIEEQFLTERKQCVADLQRQQTHIVEAQNRSAAQREQEKQLQQQLHELSQRCKHLEQEKAQIAKTFQQQIQDARQRILWRQRSLQYRFGQALASVWPLFRQSFLLPLTLLQIQQKQEPFDQKEHKEGSLFS